ncbi:hypothetical protein [Deinococcus ruber]|uniref:Uncharacterized protein n=1 Tax=Deinococcus ruber TaxID=1848197 RepID=A0A918FE39_9DEIO|nr:hypothetical protein [Deinococcus ruber]GGR27431.1 hypothetical protein GCM10008957_43430 [Deinococcus ruber]
MTPELEQAVAGLYEAFSVYRMPEEVEMSPYRTPESEIGAMKTKPLRDLSAHDLTPFAFHALTTVGNSELLKYALPRLLELVAADELAVNPEIVVGKLAYGQWRAWPATEQGAIRRYLMAWWRASLGQGVQEMGFGIDTVLTAIAQVEPDLTLYLEAWELSVVSASTDQLASFVVDLWRGERGAFQPNPFLSKDSSEWRQIERWLVRPEVLRCLEDGQLLALKRGLDAESYDLYDTAIETVRVLLPQVST